MIKQISRMAFLSLWACCALEAYGSDLFIEEKTTYQGSFKYYYSPSVIQTYEQKIKQAFPFAETVNYVSSLPLPKTPLVVRARTGEYVWAIGNQETILATEGIYDCVGVVFSYPESSAIGLCHEIWNKGYIRFNDTDSDRKKAIVRNILDYPNLKEIITKFDSQLPRGYKATTKVTLISYYMSPNLLNIGTFLQKNGFTVSAISTHDIATEHTEEIPKIYLNPRTTKRQKYSNFTLDDQPLRGRKIAVNAQGEICENFEWTLTF